jgi:hypothetical protein
MLARERLDESMEVIVQQAVAVQFKRLLLLQFAERLQERLELGLIVEHVLTVVSTIDDVVDRASVDGPPRSRHSGKPSNRAIRIE